MRDAVPGQELRQDVLWEIRLALVEVAGEQVDRQQPAPFEVEQQGEQAVGILAARQRHQPALAGPRHREILDRLARVAQQPLAQLVELDRGRRSRGTANARRLRRFGDVGIVDGHGRFSSSRLARLPGQAKTGSACHGPNTDQPVRCASISSAAVPSSELPVGPRPGDQTAIDALPGATARIPPPTPLFPGRPTR